MGRSRVVAIGLLVCMIVGIFVGWSQAQENPLGPILAVPSMTPAGVTAELPMKPSGGYFNYYRFVAKGAYVYDTVNGGNIADAECTRFSTAAGLTDGTWQKNRYTAAFASSPTSTPTNDYFDLVVNGNFMDWLPVNGQTDCATEDSVYQVTLPLGSFSLNPATGKRQVNLSVFDNNYANNSDSPGGLKVEVYPGTEPVAGPEDHLIETVTIDSRNKDGAMSATALIANEKYKFVTRNTYSYSWNFPGWQADPECSITGSSDPQGIQYDPVWKAHRDWKLAGDNTDYLDLVVNHQYTTNSSPDWTPLYESPPGSGCDDREHMYRMEYSPKTTGQVSFSIQHFHFDANIGVMYIDIYLKRSTTDGIDPKSIAGAGIGENNRKPSTEVPLATVTVSANAKTLKTVTLPGTFANYRLEVGGMFIWDYNDMNNDVADSECSRWNPADKTAPAGDPNWQQNRFGLSKSAENPSNVNQKVNEDPLDLYLNEHAIDWVPLSDDGHGCNEADHTYDYVLTAPADRRVSFMIYDPIGSNRKVDTQNINDADPSNDFSLLVKIYSAPEPRFDPNKEAFVETVKIDSAQSGGASSVSPLIAGQEYRLVAYNQYVYNYNVASDYIADAECSTIPSDHNFADTRSWDGKAGSDDLLDLYVNHASVDWIPLYDPAGIGCDVRPAISGGHTYRTYYKPPATAQLNVGVHSTFYGYMEGYLYVDIYIVKNGGTTPALPVDDKVKDKLFPTDSQSTATPLEIVKVPAGLPAGTNTLGNYQPGQSLRLEVSGVYAWDYRYNNYGNIADAECSRFVAGKQYSGTDNQIPDPTWNPKRFPTENFKLMDANADELDLYVDGGQVDWVPMTPDNTFPQCNTKDHAYYINYIVPATRSASGPFNLRVFDSLYNNAYAAGELYVKVFQGPAPKQGANDTLIDSFDVAASNESGTQSTAQLLPGKQYRIVSSGVYNYDYRRVGAKADAECTITDVYPQTDTVYKPYRAWSGVPQNDDMFDLDVNGKDIDWQPMLDTGQGCDAQGHTYKYILSPTSAGAVNLKVRHTLYSVAYGSLHIEIYLLGSSPTATDGSGPIGAVVPASGVSSDIPLLQTTLSAGPNKFAQFGLPRFTDKLGRNRFYSYYRIEVSGFYGYDNGFPHNLADAECSTYSGGAKGVVVDDPTGWHANRFPLNFPTDFPNRTDVSKNVTQFGTGQDPLDVYVDGFAVDWTPAKPDANDPMCDSTNHTYAFNYRNPKDILSTEPAPQVKLNVYEPLHNNALAVDSNVAGYSFVIRIYPGVEPASSPTDKLVGAIAIDPSNASGTPSVPLVKGRRYKFVVDGTYMWDKRTAANVADAECSVTSFDQSWTDKRSWGNPANGTYVSGGAELLDLLVDEGQRDWAPLNDPYGTGCNTVDHTYRLFWDATKTGTVQFRVNHPYPSVASGTLKVLIYDAG
ncbi:MAG: hypothetical protein ABR507_01190 [Actinomycetota bacterium]